MPDGNAFARDRLGWTVVILNLIMAANSTLYFTTQLGAGFSGWLAMNSCAPSIAVFAVGFILGQRALMAAGAGLMFRFGTLGLLAFGWEGMNIIPQIGHILMTAGVIYFVVKAARRGAAGDLITAGLMALVMVYAEWQWNWFQGHPGVLARLMDGNLAPDMFR